MKNHSPFSPLPSPLISRRGFTLTELLVVVAIIAILASLITVAARSGMIAARQAQIKMELTSIGMALETYKNKYGEYPPDFTDNAAVQRHVQKRWPRYVPISDGNFIDAFRKDIHAASGWDFTADTPNSAVALAFWLGGLPDVNGTGISRLSGFYSNPMNPFSVEKNNSGETVFNNDLGGERQPPIYEINEEVGNLEKETKGGSTTPFPYVCVRKMPVVYFRGTSSTTDDARRKAYWTVDGSGTPAVKKADFSVYRTAIPYAQSLLTPTDVKTWHNANSFQLIHPGLDGYFSGLKREPTQEEADDPDKLKAVRERPSNLVDTDTQRNMTPADLDNIVNFGESTTVEGLAK